MSLQLLLVFNVGVYFCSCQHCEVDFVELSCELGNGCLNGQCGICSRDVECGPQYTCKDNVCVHDNLFPSSGMCVLSMFLTLMISVLGGSSGMGGGSFIVPVLSILLHFKTKNAVAISQVFDKIIYS
jgi:hypothetical protein